MNFYKILVGPNYIPRRNFRYSTSYKDYTIVSSLFRNSLIRKLIYKLTYLFPYNSQISRSIKNRLFEYQSAPILEDTNFLMDFKKKYINKH